MTQTLLRGQNISASYGQLEVLEDISVAIEEGQIVALIGPNGAGKSTVIKTLFGIVEPDNGRLYIRGEDFEPVTHQMVEKDITYVPQGRQIFVNLTVKENLEMGGYTIESDDKRKERIEDVLELFPDLEEKLNDRSGSLSGGQQQMLALARGLMSNPDVLLLDEPSLGLAPKLVTKVFEKIKEINKKREMAVLIVEHNIPSLFSVVDQVYVLKNGQVAVKGEPEEVKKSGVFDTVFN
ncbi:MAG: ABC transporter ATP-binding protein [Candidatus Magasanikbacteria bacterium]